MRKLYSSTAKLFDGEFYTQNLFIYIKVWRL